MPDPFDNSYSGLTAPYTSAQTVPAGTAIPVFANPPRGFYALTAGTITGNTDGTSFAALPVVTGVEYRVRITALTAATTAALLMVS